MTGYDVQSTVILELILEGFDDLPGQPRMRPEGRDDLELSWEDPATGRAKHRFFQVKKATDGDPSATWSLADVSRDLLGDAVLKLSGNDAEQVWLLGDALSPEVERLLTAGCDAPRTERALYLAALHRVAKAELNVTGEAAGRQKYQLDRWNPTPSASFADDVSDMVNAFVSLAAGLDPQLLATYRRRVDQLHACLPDVLARTTARSYYGTEAQIVDRVRRLLAEKYKLDPETVRAVVFRNLRGFINDVSKQPGRMITKEEFEYELVTVWPRLLATTQPRQLASDHVRRPDIVNGLLPDALAHEVIGVSGSGKSALASEAFEQFSSAAGNRLVLFAEVRATTALRDVLVGVAHSLQRRGIGSVIGPALSLRATDAATIEAVAMALASIPQEVVLIMDLADGDASQGFRRDLADLCRALRGAKIRLVTFSQASLFRELSELERKALGIHRHGMRGLRFGEFVTLSSRRHPGTDRPALYDVFQRLTSDLPTGLLPTLAVELARASTLDAMRAIADCPPEQRLTAAHRARFYGIAPVLQRAASRVVCLSLPLPPSDLIALFPEEAMRAGLAMLVQEGLLAPSDDFVEMHETIRAGFAELIPPALARETHDRLAGYFQKTGMHPARIYHLEKAGRTAEAKAAARERFLSRQDWPDLVEYVASRKCVTADEVLALMEQRSEHDYLLKDLLPRVKATDTARRLFEMLRADPARYQNDFQRTWMLQEALLACEPAALRPLVEFVIGLPQGHGDVLEWLATCAWRTGVVPDEAFIQFFESLPLEQKRRSVRFLLLRPDLRRLQLAFRFLRAEQIPLRARLDHDRGVGLELTTEREIELFLEALPEDEPSQMLVARSPLLDPFGAFIWHEREILRGPCRAIASSRRHAELVVFNALRVLSFLNDAEVLTHARPLRAGDGRLASLAWMVPVILDARDELPFLQEQATSPASDVTTALTAVAIAGHLGADVGLLLEGAIAADPSRKGGFEFLMMTQAGMYPFPAAVPLLAAALDEGDPRVLGVIAPAIRRVVEARLPGSDALLLKALRCDAPLLVATTVITLHRRRIGTALEPLLEVCRTEEDAKMRTLMVTAAVACGPTAIASFEDIFEATPEAAYWRTVLAGRLRAVDEAPRLAALATDAKKPWNLRRLAIFAASRIPYGAALEAIAPVILDQPLRLADGSLSHTNHRILADLIKIAGRNALHQRFMRGRSAFVQSLAPIFDDFRSDLLDKRGVLAADEAIEWLWDRLHAYGFKSGLAALGVVEDELHLPVLQAAVLRGLRMHERTEELFAAFERADRDWLRVRAFFELSRAARASEHELRLRGLIASASAAIAPVLETLLESTGRRERASARPIREVPAPPAGLRMTYAAARRFLESTGQVASETIVLDVHENEFRTLVAELDPQRDTRWRTHADANAGHLALTESGWRLRGGRAVEESSPGYERRAALRPALAAANRFGMDIPWHRMQLTGVLSRTYANRFLTALAARNDRDLFVQLLRADAELLIPLLGESERSLLVRGLIDERALPILGRFLHAGGAPFFQSICSLICEVRGPDVIPHLTAAFRRWLVLLEQLQSAPDRNDVDAPERRAVWQTFSILHHHPQFRQIPQLTERLIELAVRERMGFWRRDVLQLLVSEPAAYTVFEAELLRSAEFEHLIPDPTDEYDEAADRLFRRFP